MISGFFRTTICLTETSSIPPSTCRFMVLLYNVWLFPSDREAWYTNASSLHTDGIISLVSVLPLYFSKVVSIISTNRPLRLCHFIGKENFSARFTSALISAVSPQIICSSPFMQILGSAKIKKCMKHA